jgi:hypothetical protein
MPKREVNLTKRINTPSGLRYCTTLADNVNADLLGFLKKTDRAAS